MIIYFFPYLAGYVLVAFLTSPNTSALAQPLSLTRMQHMHSLIQGFTNSQLPEVSPNNRAGCKDAICKKDATKITKGEIRFGAWVKFQEHGSWHWRHWYVSPSA